MSPLFSRVLSTPTLTLIFILPTETPFKRTVWEQVMSLTYIIFLAILLYVGILSKIAKVKSYFCNIFILFIFQMVKHLIVHVSPQCSAAYGDSLQQTWKL